MWLRPWRHTGLTVPAADWKLLWKRYRLTGDLYMMPAWLMPACASSGKRASHLRRRPLSPEADPRYKFHKVNKTDIQALHTIVGQGNVVTGRENLVDYGRDEAPLVKPVLPQIVVKPLDTNAVSGVLKYANLKRIPVTTRGAGTGLSGGCIPVLGGIVLSLQNMHRILEVDRENFAAVVQPGVELGKLR
ncbi:MAG: FAD-binding oxidoreductase, partial [Dehalococcoidia bacterium]